MTLRAFCGTLHLRSIGEFLYIRLSLVLIAQISHFFLFSRLFHVCPRTVIKSSVLVFFFSPDKNIL